MSQSVNQMEVQGHFQNHVLLPIAIGGVIGSSVGNILSGSAHAIEVGASIGAISAPLLWKGARAAYQIAGTNRTIQSFIQVGGRLL